MHPSEERTFAPYESNLKTFAPLRAKVKQLAHKSVLTQSWTKRREPNLGGERREDGADRDGHAAHGLEDAEGVAPAVLPAGERNLMTRRIKYDDEQLIRFRKFQEISATFEKNLE